MLRRRRSAARRSVRRGRTALTADATACVVGLSRAFKSMPAEAAPARRRFRASCMLKITPITLTPSVPPMLRLNCRVAVAVPSTLRSTLLCTAIMNAGMARPIPMPISATLTINIGSVVWGLIRVMKKVPTTSVPIPDQGDRAVAEAQQQPAADDAGADPTEHHRGEHAAGGRRAGSQHGLREKRDERRAAEHRPPREQPLADGDGKEPVLEEAAAAAPGRPRGARPTAGR